MPRSQSASSLSDRSVHTLADLLERMASDRRITDVRRREFQGAIRTLCSVLGRTPEAVPGSLSDIDRLLREVPKPVRGRSGKTIANTRSRIRAALVQCSETPRLPPRGTPLNREWAELEKRLPDKRFRNGLSRFLRMASFEGLLPHEVDEAFFKKVVRRVSQQDWGFGTRGFERMTAMLWNEAAATIPGWPKTTLTPPPNAQRARHLRLDEFPISFQRDVEAYLAWAAGADPLAPNAPDRPLKPSTLRLRREQLRLAASTLARHLGGPQHITSLARLVEPSSVKTILTALLDAAEGHRPTAFIRGLALALLTLARTWVKASPDQVEELKRMKRKLGNTPSGLTEKNRHVVRMFSDPRLLAGLLALPDTLIERARAGRISPGRKLQLAQVAIAIELLLAAPMRMQNLVTLRIGHQLQWPSGRDGTAYVVLRRDETKNDQPLEYPIDGRTKDLLHEYLDRYRPLARPGESDWLFVRSCRKPLADFTLRDGITKAVLRELGVRLTPHQFRHLAAAVALDARPGAIGLVRDLLGHKSHKTTAGFYAGMRTREAGREYDKILARSRDPATKRS